MPSAHTSRDFEAELRELRAHTLAMGARCERIFQLALDAFWEASPEATHLERVGDEAVNIAERTREGPGSAREFVKDDLREMSEESQQMLREALDSFVQADVTMAERVLGRDDAVDGRYGNVLRAMTEFMASNPQEIPAAIRVIHVAKHLERVADHATNIAEEVIFMVRGEDVRHTRTYPPPGVATGGS